VKWTGVSTLIVSKNGGLRCCSVPSHPCSSWVLVARGNRFCCATSQWDVEIRMRLAMFFSNREHQRDLCQLSHGIIQIYTNLRCLCIPRFGLSQVLGWDYIDVWSFLYLKKDQQTVLWPGLEFVRVVPYKLSSQVLDQGCQIHLLTLNGSDLEVPDDSATAFEARM
jgi:hypothetical protein